MKAKQLEQVAIEIFSQSSSNVVSVRELSKKKAEEYKKYFNTKGYTAVMGGVASIVDKNEVVYELHIWRRS